MSNEGVPMALRLHTVLTFLPLLATPALSQDLPRIDSVVHAASFEKSTAERPFSYGSLLTITGRDLAKETLSVSTAPLPRRLGGTRVVIQLFIGPRQGSPGLAAPRQVEAALLYVSPTQVNFILPVPPMLHSLLNVNGGYDYNDGRATLKVVVDRDGELSEPVLIEAQKAGMIGIFVDTGGSPNGPAVAFQADERRQLAPFDPPNPFILARNSRDQPARPGQWVALAMSGGFTTGPQDGFWLFADEPYRRGIRDPNEGDDNARPQIRHFLDNQEVVLGDWNTFPTLIAIQQIHVPIPADARSTCAMEFRTERQGSYWPRYQPGTLQVVTIAVARPGETCDGKPLPIAIPD
jgi:uncharacterized protein (TIGR03437 family)